MRFRVLALLLFFKGILFQVVAHAQIHLPKLFGDHYLLWKKSSV